MQINFVDKNSNKTLDQLKAEKMDSLDTLCNQSISGTFSYTVNGTVYNFWNDTIAQSNFDKASIAFTKGFMTQVPWTAYDSSNNPVRLTFDATSFDGLYTAHLNHIQSNIVKFRDTLAPQVATATSEDDLKKINW